MNASVYDLDRRTRREFTLPADWLPERWRWRPVLACGLSALAVEAALTDLGAKPPVVLQDPNRLDHSLDCDPRAVGGILGFSLSGRSPEVLDGLARAARRGLPTCRVGGLGPQPPGVGPPDVQLPPLDAPEQLAHLAFAAVVPTLRLGHPVPAPRPVGDDPALRGFLGDLLKTSRVPIFVATGDGLEARRLRSLWIELVGRPAFTARFPDFTHDLLWSFERTRDDRFAWVLRRPQVDLSDGRFDRLLGWLHKGRTPHHLLDTPDGEAGAVGGLLAAAELFCRLLADRGRPLPRGLDMDDDAKVTAR